MSIDKTKCCNMHTEEKEQSGECCQIKEEKNNAETLTYENETKRSNNE